MSTLIAPFNSLAESENEFEKPLAPNKRESMSTMTRSGRKSCSSVSDHEIIKEFMSLERKKTLICAEQDNFKMLKKFKASKSPKKKFSSGAPSEYEKYILSIRKINISKTDNLRYEYPEGVLSCNQINLIKENNPQEYNEMKKKEFVQRKD